MQITRGPALSVTPNLKTATLLCAFAVFLFVPWAQSQQFDMNRLPAVNMNALTLPEDLVEAVKQLADRQESEFNHHLVGILVLFAGIFVLAESQLAKRWPLVRYACPLCFFAAGLFVLVFSDTEIWPFGPQTPWYAITHNPEDLQHKIFAVILLALGYVELQIVRGRWKSPWAAWFFPLVATAGAILLLFHAHSGDMQAPNAMDTLERIQVQHRWFATMGLGVALANGAARLTQAPKRWQRVLSTAWPMLLIVLGILLTRYTE